MKRIRAIARAELRAMGRKWPPAAALLRALSRRGERKTTIGWWETRRLQLLPRFYHTTSPLLGRRVRLSDPYWYVRCHDEIFRDQIYRFRSKRADPLIIDCGANIGLSVLYFKHLYPASRIIAFEPDPTAFAMLKRNVDHYGLAGVDLHEEAVWSSETELPFWPDGSVGGHVVEETPANVPAAIVVRAFRLRHLLNQTVDFLKLDIEGSEHEVAEDCRGVLRNVERMFVEYHGNRRAPQKLHEMLYMLQEAGFRYHIKEANPIRHPFMVDEYPSRYDLQLNVFCLRDLA